MENRNDIANELQSLKKYRAEHIRNEPLRLVKNHPVFENDILLMEGANLLCRISDIRGDSFDRLESKEETANRIFEAVNNYQSLKESNAALIDAAESVLNTLDAMVYDDMIGGMKMVLQEALNKAKNI
jgi:hypothetical protein